MPRVRPKPPWLKVRPPGGGTYGDVKRGLQELGLHTVCEEARCPNLGECWGCGTATFLILGETCTRGCRFCAVATGDPGGVVDAGEPARVAEAALRWKLRYVVLTSVDRDDLPDGGAAHFVATLRAIRERSPGTKVEVLTPDFAGSREALQVVLEAAPDVFAHNLEVVRRLSPRARDRRASYEGSLAVLRMARELRPEGITKSSLMLGLGETDDELREALADLREAGVTALTLGQYLQPAPRCLPVEHYVEPARFDTWAEEARALGFAMVASGPLVRSSYRAGELALQGALRGT
ncbi:MAG: lipoyl synthase [Pseudomonadota bacterium]